MRRPWLTALLLAACAGGVASAGDPADGPRLRAEIERLVATVTRAAWTQTSWQRLGQREEYVAARCRWAGQDRMRLDVFEGRGAGSVAVLQGDRVTGYKRGLLSFAKRSYPVRHPRVLSLRGHDLRDNGFLDDFRALLDRWERVRTEFEGDREVLAFTDEAGLEHRLLLAGTPPVVARHEVREDGELVEVYTYADVDYRAEFDLGELRTRD